MSAFAFVIAMLSKGSVAVLPVVLLLIVWWRRGRIDRFDLMRCAPFFLIAVVMTPVIMWFIARGSGEIRSVTLLERFLEAGSSIWFYLSKAMLPMDLVFVYPQWSIECSELLWWLPLAAVVVVSAVLWRRRDQSRVVALWIAWAYFCITLVPVIGFTDTGFMKYSLVADHYQHLAIIGVAALAGAGWYTWRSEAKGIGKDLASAAAAFAVCALAVLTFQQSKLYGTPIRLYEATLARNPNSWMVHNNLGRALTDAGRIDEEIAQYQIALNLRSDLPEVRDNLAIALLKKGRTQEAIEQCLLALKQNADLAAAYTILGDAYLQSNRPDDAAEQFRHVLRLDPQSSNAHFQLGNIYRQSGQLAEAIEQYHAALQLNSDSPDAYNGLGNALRQAGRFSEAAEMYQRALQLKPDLPEAHNNLGLLLARSGHLEEAIEQYQAALRLLPDFSAAHFNLGNALVKAGRPSEAAEQFQQVLRLVPGDLEAAVNCMGAYADAGRMTEAVSAAEKVADGCAVLNKIRP